MAKMPIAVLGIDLGKNSFMWTATGGQASFVET